MDKKKLKDIILKTLEKEGGAAGLKALAKAAKTPKNKLKKDLDAFSKEMVLHFIDNPAAEAAVMMRNAKSKSDEYKPGTTDELPFE